MSRPLVAVLAGGRASRLGGAKATAPLGGRPLIAWPLAAAAAFDAVVVAKAATLLPEVGVPVWLEPEAPHHPLVGLVCALERAERDVIAVAADMPFVTAEALEALAATKAPCGPEPLLARYSPDCLPALRAALAARAPLFAAFRGLSPASVAIDPACLANVNTPEDLAAAQARLAPGEQSAPPLPT